MPLLLVSCLTRVLCSNATEKNVKCEVPPCPALEQRAGREHPAKGGGDRRGGDQGQGKGPKDGAVSGNACGCESPQHRPGSVLCIPLWSVEGGFSKEPPEAVKLGVKRLLPDWLLGEQRDH